MLPLLLAANIYIDMYQDRTDKNRTIVIIETEQTTDTYTVDNNKLEQFVIDMETKYEQTK